MKNAFYKDKWNCEIVQAQFDCIFLLDSLQRFSLIWWKLINQPSRLHFNVNVLEFSHVKKVKQYLICVKLSTFSLIGMHFITAIVEFTKQFTVYTSYAYLSAVKYVEPFTILKSHFENPISVETLYRFIYLLLHYYFWINYSYVNVKGTNKRDKICFSSRMNASEKHV